MGRLVSSNIEIQIEPSNVSQIVRELIASMQPGIDGRVVTFICDDAPPAVPIDRRLIRLAIKQLVDNALKYSPQDRPVVVHLHNNPGALTVAVTDHGEGIPAKEQERIFDRLYRSPSVERQIPGSGLGLSIAQNIARAHKGNLTVSSRPGETTFHLSLPLNRKEAHS
jgi:two-component system sensor histidine kinase SenX3